MKRLILLLALPILAMAAMAIAAEPARAPLYYQAPGGAPFYAAGPKQTPDGRDYVPVFEDAPMTSTSTAPHAANSDV